MQNIFKTSELEKFLTTQKIRVVQNEGTQKVSREVTFYSLDAIIAVGYRINSKEATDFRIWATKTLKEYILREYPVYLLRSEKTMYAADPYIGAKNSIFVGYNKIGRLKRKINKKVKQGYMTEEQGIRCILTIVCTIVEDELGLL